MKIVTGLLHNKIALSAIALSAAVLIAAVCFYGVLPDDIKPGKNNPQMVQAVRAVPTSYDSVTLKWGKAQNATGYEIFRSTEEDGDYEVCGEAEQTEYVDKKLDTGTEYWYMIRSTKGKKESRYSSRVKATPELDRPVIKGFSTEEGAEVSCDKIPGATGYVFFRDGKQLREQRTNVFLDGGIKEQERHTYQVIALRQVGKAKASSPKSNQVTAGKIQIKMTLEDGTKLEKVYAGEKIEIAGLVKSNVKIKKIEIGATDEAGNNWIEGQKYEKDSVNEKEFDVKNADASVKFGELPEGKYKFKVMAYPEGGKPVVVSEQTFEVDDNPAMAAVNWAIEIANDNSFTYGTGKKAHKRGCYFCGTNKKYKPSGYEKTYCCNPFVLAAFAHGANNEKVLKGCQKGECGGMDPGDWTRYGCFETVGTTKSVPYEDLLPGDFIISKKSAGGPFEHVWLYCGEDKYVDAGSEGWGAGSISVKDNAPRNYKRYQTNGCHVMRYTGE